MTTHDEFPRETENDASPAEPFPRGDDEPLAEGEAVRSGSPLAEGVAPVAGEEPVIAALRTVFDPEIPVNIYDLGLIYDLKIDERGDVAVAMTLTAPGCPVAGSLPREVADVVAAVDGVGQVAVSMTWDPPWTQANMSEAARVALDMF